MSEFKGWIIGGIVFILMFCFGLYACEKTVVVQPGHVGVLVKKCGGGGVDPDPVSTGYHWRELFCEEVDQYPITMQSLILTKNPHEGTGGPHGNEDDQSITVTSSEGLGVNCDVNLNFMLEPKLVPAIYLRWKADIEIISHTYIRQTIREALQDTFAKYTAEELYSTKKETARAEVETFLVNKLKVMGFNISQFTINRVEPPQQVITAINAKVAMVQSAQQSEQEVRKRKAEAAQAVAIAEGQASAAKAKAEGDAAAITAIANAQAQANKVLAESVTPQLVEYMKAQRWNGMLPSTVAGGAVPMIPLK